MKLLTSKIEGNYELGEHVTSLYAAYLDIDEDKVIYIFDESNKPEDHFSFLAKMDITHPYIMSGNIEEWKSDFIIMFKKELLQKGLCKENAAGTLFALSEADSNERIRIGKKIEELREQAGLSQRDLAARCGIAQSTVYRIEAGKFAVRLDLLESIANVLGKKVDLV